MLVTAVVVGIGGIVGILLLAATDDDDPVDLDAYLDGFPEQVDPTRPWSDELVGLDR